MIAPPLAGQVLGSSDSSFAIAEWRDQGGPPGPPRWIAPLHMHHHSDEAWYVLEGSLCVRVGEDEVEVPAGAGILVPRGMAHTYRNPGPGPTRYLLFMTPTVLRLIEAIHGMEERGPAALAAVFAAHDSTFVEWA